MYECAERHPVGNALQDVETFVRDRGSVQIETMAVEAPGGSRLRLEGVRIGNVVKIDPGPPQGRINAPKTTRPPEIRHAGIDTHAGARGNDEAVGMGQQIRGLDGCTFCRIVEVVHGFLCRLCTSWFRIWHGREGKTAAIDLEGNRFEFAQGHVH